jgi:hypothetical protein
MAMLMSDLPPVFPRSTDEVPAKSKGKRRRSTPARASEDSDGDSDESERPQTMQRRATPPAQKKRRRNIAYKPLDENDPNYGDVDKGLNSDEDATDIKSSDEEDVASNGRLFRLEEEPLLDWHVEEDVTSIAGHHADLNEESLREMSKSGWISADVHPEEDDVSLRSHENVYDGRSGPSVTVLRAADEGFMQLFFYFLPKTFWIEVAYQTNAYESMTRKARIRERTKAIKLKIKDIQERYVFPRVFSFFFSNIFRLSGLLKLRLC